MGDLKLGGSDDASLARGLALLSSLRLPFLAGKSFLDVGVAEGGLFSEFAVVSGASRVLGLAQDKDALEMALGRVSGVEFREADVETFHDETEERFDVICLSVDFFGKADPGEFIPLLMQLLTPQGVLVIDWPILDEDGPEFKEIKTDTIGAGLVGQFSAVRSLCGSSGWRFRRIGQSAREPMSLPRQVYHLAHGVRDFYLLLGESTSGKSTKARFLASLPGAIHISGDRVLWQIYNGQTSCSEELRHVVRQSQESEAYTNWFEAYRHILDSGMEAEFLATALEDVPEDGMPIFDAYIPDWGQDNIAKVVKALGYNAVTLKWEHPLPTVSDSDHLRQISVFREHRSPHSTKMRWWKGKRT